MTEDQELAFEKVILDALHWAGLDDAISEDAEAVRKAVFENGYEIRCPQ